MKINIQTDKLALNIIETTRQKGITNTTTTTETRENQDITEATKTYTTYLIIKGEIPTEEAEEIIKTIKETYPLNNQHEPYVSNIETTQQGLNTTTKQIKLEFPLKEKYYTGKTYNP